MWHVLDKVVAEKDLLYGELMNSWDTAHALL